MNNFLKFYYKLINEIKIDPIDTNLIHSNVDMFKKEFKIDNIDYIVELQYINELCALKVLFYNKSKGSFLITSDSNYNSIKVMSYVIGCIHGTILKIKQNTGYFPIHIYFSANASEISRISLYDKLVKYNKIKNTMEKYGYVYNNDSNILIKIAEIENIVIDNKDSNKVGKSKIYCFTLEDKL